MTGKLIRNLEQRLRIGPGKCREAAREEWKQRVTTLSSRLRKYKDMTQTLRDNRDFQNNQGAFYRRLEKDEKPVEPEERHIEFWKNIWSVPGQNAPNMPNLTDSKQEQQLVNTKGQVIAALRKMKNWKAAGPDQVQAYWLKKFTNVLDELTKYLNTCLKEGCPNWMRTGHTLLLPKKKAGDTRPITCLTTTWKLLTSIIAESITKYYKDTFKTFLCSCFETVFVQVVSNILKT